jgi:hypothetical protein
MSRELFGPFAVEAVRMLRSAIAIVALAATLAVAACASTPPNTSSVSAAFNSPPGYPGYQWTRNGKPVRYEELSASAGPNHCDWQSATILHLGWPVGTASANAGEERVYIRDPKGVMGGTYRQDLVTHAKLPADARPTGYRLGNIEIYLSPSDQDRAVYLATSSGAERWPRANPFYGCA